MWMHVSLLNHQRQRAQGPRAVDFHFLRNYVAGPELKTFNTTEQTKLETVLCIILHSFSTRLADSGSEQGARVRDPPQTGLSSPSEEQ